MPTLRARAGVSGTVEAQTTTAGGMTGMRTRGKFLDPSAPSFWATAYFLAALGYIFLMYFGHGGSRGLVL